MDTIAIASEHAVRIAAVDPLLPTPPPLDPGAGILLSTERGAAIAWYSATAPGLASRTWEPDRRHNLEVRLAGDDRAATLGDLLDQWAGRIKATPGDLDSAAIVELPSRDTEAVPALVHRGFVPCSVLAVRRAGHRGQPGASDVVIRPATEADLDVAVELNMTMVRYDASFGKVTPREATEQTLRNQLAFLLSQPTPVVWLAERAGRVVGLVHIQLPPVSTWALKYTSAPSVAYLAALSVAPDERGGGVGAALAAHAHQVIDDAGLPVTVLHHALPNPRSAPFWYANGYRPLWTQWMRRPVIR